MNRLEVHSYFLAIARVVAQRSTCRIGSVGCVIVDKERKIIATGYNGTPPGAPHEPQKHSKEECKAIHAEANALSYIRDKDLSEAICYISKAPCPMCYNKIYYKGIRTIYYAVAGSTTEEVEQLAERDGVTLVYWPSILYEEVI